MIQHPALILLASWAAMCAAPTAAASIISDATIDKVKSNMIQISTHSWEIGTALEALTELEWPSLSVFGGPLPPPAKLPSGTASDVIEWATK